MRGGYSHHGDWPVFMLRTYTTTKKWGVLQLMQTMPMRLPPGLTRVTETAPTLVANELDKSLATVVPKAICCVCRKEDVGLLFCDTCPDESLQLYHPECLTFKPGSTKRLCEYCLQCSKDDIGEDFHTPQKQTKSGTNSISTTTDMINTSPWKEVKSPTQMDKSKQATEQMTSLSSSSSPPASPSSSSSSSSSSASSSTSSSSSSVSSYAPTYQRKTPRDINTTQRKLPNLMGSIQDMKIKPIQTPGEIATKSRASARLLKIAEQERTTHDVQRQKKLPEDAYDSPTEDGSDIDTIEE